MNGKVALGKFADLHIFDLVLYSVITVFSQGRDGYVSHDGTTNNVK